MDDRHLTLDCENSVTTVRLQGVVVSHLITNVHGLVVFAPEVAHLRTVYMKNVLSATVLLTIVVWSCLSV